MAQRYNDDIARVPEGKFTGKIRVHMGDQTFTEVSGAVPDGNYIAECRGHISIQRKRDNEGESVLRIPWTIVEPADFAGVRIIDFPKVPTGMPGEEEFDKANRKLANLIGSSLALADHDAVEAARKEGRTLSDEELKLERVRRAGSANLDGASFMGKRVCFSTQMQTLPDKPGAGGKRAPRAPTNVSGVRFYISPEEYYAAPGPAKVMAPAMEKRGITGGVNTGSGGREVRPELLEKPPVGSPKAAALSLMGVGQGSQPLVDDVPPPTDEDLVNDAVVDF